MLSNEEMLADIRRLIGLLDDLYVDIIWSPNIREIMDKYREEEEDGR